MTTPRTPPPRRPRANGPTADPAHAPGKHHLGRDDSRDERGVRLDTQSHEPESESRVGRGRVPRRG